MRQLPGIIRIVLADGHKLVRESLVSLLNAVSDFDVIGTAGDGAELLALLRYKNPNLILLDYRMPRLNGVEVVKKLSDDKPWLRIVVLSTYAQPAHVKDMLRSGVHGYVSKSCSTDELIEAIRKVHAGKSYLSRMVQDVVIQDFAEVTNDADPSSGKFLTPREIKVLQYLSEGQYVSEISSRLQITEKTVERDKTGLMKKLNARNTGHLIRLAIEKGFITEKITLIS